MGPDSVIPFKCNCAAISSSRFGCCLSVTRTKVYDHYAIGQYSLTKQKIV